VNPRLVCLRMCSSTPITATASKRGGACPPQRSRNRCDAAYGQDADAPFDQIDYGARNREDEIVGET